MLRKKQQLQFSIFQKKKKCNFLPVRVSSTAKGIAHTHTRELLIPLYSHTAHVCAVDVRESAPSHLVSLRWASASFLITSLCSFSGTMHRCTRDMPMYARCHLTPCKPYLSFSLAEMRQELLHSAILLHILRDA